MSSPTGVEEPRGASRAETPVAVESVTPDPPAPAPARPVPPRGVVWRFRVIAYLVGTGLVILMCVGMPLKYLADSPGVVAAVSPVHGLLYMAYLVCTLDLGLRSGFSRVRVAGLMLAGTIPFLSFVVERQVTRELRKAGAH